MSVSLDSITNGDGVRRDRWGRYLVVPPTGGEPIGYTRTTTVAKALDDGGSLGPWQSWHAVVGLMRRPGLASQVELLQAETNGDGWYHSEDSKKAAKRIVAELQQAGGTSNRAEQGTSYHALTALLDVGRSVSHVSPTTERDLAAYVDGLDSAGVKVLPEYVETTVVLDEYRVAGTFDRLVLIEGYDRPVVADLKTGADIGYSAQSFATQLACYANADNVYVQGPAPDGSLDERLPMPDVERGVGLIMWLPIGEARLELHVVDLHAGWESFTTSLWVRGWRNRDDLMRVLPSRHARQAHARAAASLLPELPAAGAGGAVDGAGEAEPAPQPLAASPAPTTPTLTIVEPFETHHEADERERAQRDAIRAWLQERVDAIGQHERARGPFVDGWQALGVPTLASSTDHTEPQLLAIEALCDDIEHRYSLPFGPSRPGDADKTPADWLDRLRGVFPGTTTNPPHQGAPTP